MAADSSRSVYVRINLDAITNNIRVLRSMCPDPIKTGVIGVVKAGAYGHGSVIVSKHMKKIGVERLAGFTVSEGVHLRNHGVTGPIHVLANPPDREMSDCVEHSLIPMVCSEESVAAMATAITDTDHLNTKVVTTDGVRSGSVNIKVDSGMSRNGCQPDELANIIEKCESQNVPVDGIFTHFSASWDNPDFTKMQMDTFLAAVAPYRSRGINFHVANSGAVLRGYGTDLDFIRPGNSVYGLPASWSPGDTSEEFQSFGLKPAAAVIGCPTLVKRLKAGRKVGYSCAYTADGEEYIATIPLGYADGYWTQLAAGRGVVIRDKTGEKLPVVGLVSMDSITVSLPECVPVTETFTILSDDYDPQTSAIGIATALGTVPEQITTRLSTRLMRVYVQDSKSTVVKPLAPEIY